MLDWITVTIEVVGVVILLMWVVIPIREFRQILRAVKHKPHALPDAAADDPRGGFPVDGDATSPRREDGNPA